MTWRTIRSIATAELAVERRSGDALAITVPFGVAALMVMALSVGADVPLLRRIGPGTYWALVLLFGSLVTLRHRFVDAGPRRDALRLLDVDPVAVWVAGAIISSTLVLALELVLAPAAAVLYDLPAEGLSGQAAAGLLAAVGIGSLSAWAAEVVGTDRGRRSLVPLIVTPLGVPLVLAGSQIQQGTAYDASPLPWLLLSASTVLLIMVIGTASVRQLQEVD